MGDTPAWLQAVSQMGAVGVIAWLVYHHTAVGQPKLIERIEKITDQNNATIKEVCASFEACVKEERAAFREEIRDMREGFKCAGKPARSS